MFHVSFLAGTRLLIPGSALLIICACSDPSGPVTPGNSVLVTSGESHTLTVLDGLSGRIVSRISLAAGVDVAALSPDGATLYLSEDSSSPGDLVAIDTYSLQVRWREAQSTSTEPRYQRWGGVGVAAYYALAPSRDGSTLYAAPAFHADSLGSFSSGTLGVAAIGADDRDPVAHELGVLPRQFGLAPPPATSALGQGELLLGGSRDINSFPQREWLYMLNPLTLTIDDSMGVVGEASDGSRYIVMPRYAPDGRDAYVMSAGATAGLFKIDVASRTVIHSALVGLGGAFAISPDGARLYQTHPNDAYGVRASLLVYDSTLTLVRYIDLPTIDGHPPALLDVAVSPDGSRVYATAGTGSRVALDGVTQSGILIAVDPTAGKVLWTTPLNVWLPRQVFVR